MDFFEVVKRRRSVRRYADEPVPEGHLRLMLEAARLAPSATNEQPWRFIVVRNHELKQAMHDVVQAMLEAHIEAARSEERREHVRSMRFYATHFVRAPVVMAVLARPWPAARPTPRQVFDPGLQSVAAAVSQFVLAATALGYASCWATSPVDFAGAELGALLAVEPPWYLVAIVSLVKGADAPAPAPRKPLEEIARFVD
jgi:nitroreductase